MSLSAETIPETVELPALELRLARSETDIEAAQRLRYQVFCEELGAFGLRDDLRPGLDHDRFDAFCDHLLVIDPARPAATSVVGTYRLLPGSRLDRAGDFYSASEFDLAPLLANGPSPEKLLECGRSCVAAGYRSNHTVQLLWRGIAAYMADHRIEAMFGCASLNGTNPEALAPAIAFMQHHALAPKDLRVTVLADQALQADFSRTPVPDRRTALKALPPLIKAYLRLGAWVGQGAAVDPVFDTTDVFVLLPTNRIPARYHARFDSKTSVQVAGRD
jgi:putative hemolysin